MGGPASDLRGLRPRSRRGQVRGDHRGDERTTRILAGLDAETAKSVDPAEFARYEAKAHEIITSHGATVVCLYDERALPPAFLEVSSLRHGLTVEGGAARRNERFEYEPA